MFIWAPVYSCTHWQRTPKLPPPPRIWAHIRGRYWSAKIDDISLKPTALNHRFFIDRSNKSARRFYANQRGSGRGRGAVWSKMVKRGGGGEGEGMTSGDGAIRKVMSGGASGGGGFASKPETGNWKALCSVQYASWSKKGEKILCSFMEMWNYTKICPALRAFYATPSFFSAKFFVITNTFAEMFKMD